MTTFTEQQRTAISLSPEGVYRLIAAAGSGKTAVLTNRIAFLLQSGVAPESVLSITFTKKAAKEMEERLVKLIGKPLANRVNTNTIHSLGFRILREFWKNQNIRPYFILEESDQKNIFKRIMGERSQNNPDGLGFDCDLSLAMSTISGFKNSLKGVQEAKRDQACIDEPMFYELYRRYEAIKEGKRQIDFDDMLYRAWKVLSENPAVLQRWQRSFKYLLVDEAQDTNKGQWEMIKMLALPQNNLFIVGDDSQAIYGFRGGLPEVFIGFNEIYPQCQTYKLTRNFRSRGTIVHAGDRLIQNNTNRYPKEVDVPESAEGGEEIRVNICADVFEEAAQVANEIDRLNTTMGVPFKDIAILYRTNNQSRAVEDEMIKYGIPYVIVGGTGFYNRREVMDMIAYLRLAHDVNDNESLKRIINVPKRYLGKVFVDQLESEARRRRCSLYEALQNCERWTSGYQSRNAMGLVRIIRALKRHRGTVSELIAMIRQETKYDEYLSREEGITDEGGSRLDNIVELQAAAERFGNNLGEFVEFVKNIQQAGRSRNEDMDAVKLMTIHRSKGLEFHTVFIVGACEGVLPHHHSVAIDDVEEERRLAYVALTRAKQLLYISAPLEIPNREGGVEPSRFIAEAIEWYDEMQKEQQRQAAEAEHQEQALLPPIEIIAFGESPENDVVALGA